jgi:hypothetical protein
LFVVGGAHNRRCHNSYAVAIGHKQHQAAIAHKQHNFVVLWAFGTYRALVSLALERLTKRAVLGGVAANNNKQNNKIKPTTKPTALFQKVRLRLIG